MDDPLPAWGCVPSILALLGGDLQQVELAAWKRAGEPGWWHPGDEFERHGIDRDILEA
jgi:hypothetical protein